MRIHSYWRTDVWKISKHNLIIKVIARKNEINVFVLPPSVKYPSIKLDAWYTLKQKV